MDSMTGYGRSISKNMKRTITAEIRSVNNRYLDISIKTPKKYSFIEEAVRDEIKKVIGRGKISVNIYSEGEIADDIAVKVDANLAKEYKKAFEKLTDCIDVEMKDFAVFLLNSTEVISEVPEEADEGQIKNEFLEVFKEALNGMCKMRFAEGEKLKEDIKNRISKISDIKDEIKKRLPSIEIEYLDRIKKNISDMLPQEFEISETRILTEVAIFAEKISITEEIVRIESHINQFLNMLKAPGPIGKKMDFLVQEMNREVNTIGSKVSDLNVTKNVIELKSEIEKIREQVQNIE